MHLSAAATWRRRGGAGRSGRGRAHLVSLDLCNLLVDLMLCGNAPAILGLAALGDGHGRRQPRAHRRPSTELRAGRERRGPRWEVHGAPWQPLGIVYRRGIGGSNRGWITESRAVFDGAVESLAVNDIYSSQSRWRCRSKADVPGRQAAEGPGCAVVLAGLGLPRQAMGRPQLQGPGPARASLA